MGFRLWAVGCRLWAVGGRLWAVVSELEGFGDNYKHH